MPIDFESLTIRELEQKAAEPKTKPVYQVQHGKFWEDVGKEQFDTWPGVKRQFNIINE